MRTRRGSRVLGCPGAQKGLGPPSILQAVWLTSLSPWPWSWPSGSQALLSDPWVSPGGHDWQSHVGHVPRSQSQSQPGTALPWTWGHSSDKPDRVPYPWGGSRYRVNQKMWIKGNCMEGQAEAKLRPGQPQVIFELSCGCQGGGSQEKGAPGRKNCRCQASKVRSSLGQRGGSGWGGGKVGAVARHHGRILSKGGTGPGL